MNRRGLALIVVVGVLGVLSVLAVAFVTMAQLERKASQQRTNAAKAYLLARSGIEDALARLALGQDSSYGGENWDGSSDGLLSSFEAAQEVYRPTGIGTAADLGSCPLRQAMRPSFFVRGGLNPATLGMEGRRRGYSGVLSGDTGSNGNTWALKVEERGGIHVNGGDLTSAGEHPGTYDTTLKRILGNLAEELGSPLLRADGEALVTQRPSGGWGTMDQIQAMALGGDATKLEAFRPYLALSAWVDRKVIKPTALPALEGSSPKAWAEIRKGSSDDPVGGSNYFTGGRSGLPAFEPRAPVSLSWARKRKPVVAALVRDLKGLYLDETTAGNYNPSVAGGFADAIGTLRTVTMTSVEAGRVATQLEAWTSDLGSWQSFHAFCDSLDSSVLTGSSDEVQAKRDLLKANFNPNSDLNKFNPNPSLWKSVDKLDLLAYSTEFSLLSPGSWRISSAGRILDPSGRLLGQRMLSAGSSSDLVRITTQGEFVTENLNRLDVAGDEPGPSRRMPGYKAAGAPEFITQSQGLDKTWGHRLNTSGAYPGGWMDGDSQGLSLQSYPEPCVAMGALTQAPASYDGNLQLATVETGDDQMYGVTAATQDMKMLARFNDSFDLDRYDSTAASGGLLVRDAQMVQVPTHSVLNHLTWQRPNTLYPDGAYSERYRAPIYPTEGNANGYHGLLSFWVKPNSDVSKAEVRGHQYVQWTSPGSQFFCMGQVADTVPPFNMFGFQYEVCHSGSDIGNEVSCATPFRSILPHRWHLVSLYYDFHGTATWGDAIGLRIDDGSGADNTGVASYYGDPPNLIPEDIAQSNALALGSYGDVSAGGDGLDFLYRSYCKGSGAEATFDEFAIYDFGQAPGSLAVLATGRYKAGRYYKGSAYTNLLDTNYAPAPDQAAAYFTAPIRLPANAYLQRVQWTWYRPQALPDDYAEIELVEPTGASYLGGDEASSRSTKSSGWTVDRQSWDVNRALPGPFRAHVVFRRKTPVNPNTPLLDSPVLDDLSFLYGLGSLRISDWEEGS